LMICLCPYVIVLTAVFFSLIFLFLIDTPAIGVSILSLHDALPILKFGELIHTYTIADAVKDKTILPLYYEGLMIEQDVNQAIIEDRKSTRLNSSHVSISYAVFCLKKKTEKRDINNVFDTSSNNTSR